MKYFTVRFIIFVSLWAWVIYESSTQITVSFFMFSASIGLFFFHLRKDYSIYLVLTNSLVIFIHGLIIKEFLVTSLLLLFLLMLSVGLMGKMSFYILIGVEIVLFSVLVYFNNINAVGAGILAVIVVSILHSMHALIGRDAQMEDELERYMIENRQLKRMNISTEEVIRAEERTHIAREIHDSVGHQLTALMMKLEILQIEEPNESYVELKEMAKQSLKETRQAVETLQSKEAYGLNAVVQLIRKLELESRLRITFTIKDGVLSLSLSNQHSIVIYRVIQEALTNIMRHADTKQVNILIGMSAMGTLNFKITNRLVKPQKFSFGFGLKNMQARVEEVGGKLKVYQTEKAFIIEGVMPYE